MKNTSNLLRLLKNATHTAHIRFKRNVLCVLAGSVVCNEQCDCDCARCSHAGSSSCLCDHVTAA